MTMPKRNGDMSGWTCAHVRPHQGPCSTCNPGTGWCGGCGRPLDDHLDWPRRCYPRGQSVYAQEGRTP